MNKQSIAENEVFKPERQRPSIISAHTEDTVMIQDPFFFRKLKQKTIKYYAPWEPDGVLLKYWCRFNHLAKKLKDESFSENYTFPHGSPKLCAGPDDGVKGGRIVTRINSNPNVLDWFSTPDHTSIRTSSASNGFSLYLEFIAESLANDGQDSTLQYKFDDSNNLRVIRLRPDGTITFLVKKAGTTTDFASPVNAITVNTLHKCWFTFNPSGNVISVRVNNVPQSDTGNLGITEENGTTELIHGKRGSATNGRFVGRLLDSRMYNFVVNGDHMNNIWNNARSICASNVIFFDGTDNRIDCSNDATLWSQSLTKFAFSLWIYPFDVGTTRDIVRHGVPADGAARFRMEIIPTGIVRFSIRNNANSADAVAEVTGLVANKWQRVLGSYDNSLGSANVKAFLSGVLGATTANHTEAKNLSATLTIGGSPVTTHLSGHAKDFRWWTNDAFDAVEAEEFWNSDVMPSTPNYWLKMNEGNGNPIDFITRTKVGTLTNGAAWILGSSPRPTEFGSLAVAGYTRFNDTVDAGGYDSVGYDSTGFDTT